MNTSVLLSDLHTGASMPTPATPEQKFALTVTPLIRNANSANLSIYTVKETAFGGKIIIERQFYNPETQDYICLEAHETENGTFEVAEFVPEGNNGNPFNPYERSSDLPSSRMNLQQLVEAMGNYKPETGMIEMTIPEEAWC